MFDAVAQALLGVALVHQGNTERGLESQQRAQTTFGQILGPDHPMTQLYLLNNAIALVQLGRANEAMDLVSRADPVLREAFGADAPVYARVLRLRTRLTALLKMEEAQSPNLPSKQRPDQPLTFDFFS